MFQGTPYRAPRVGDVSPICRGASRYHSLSQPVEHLTALRPMTILKPAFTFLLLLAAASPSNQSAIQQLQALRQSIRKSRDAKDWQSNVATARDLKAFMNGSPNSLLELSRAEIHVGDMADAIRNVQQFARMGQSTELFESSQEFAALRDQTTFAEIQRAMNANRTSVGLASPAFPLSDSRLLAEDVDYDPLGKQFLVTSIREKKIISAASGSIRDFAKAPDNWSMMAIKVDSKRGLLWATEVALQGLVFAPEPDWGRSAVLSYDLKTGKLLRRIEGPHGTALGDMTLTGDGDVIVSDGEGGGVYRLSKSDALARLDNGDFISPQTPAMHPDGKHIFVPDYLRGIGVLDLATRQVHWLSTEGRFALNGIDGLYLHSSKLIAVQNGTSPERVVEFTLNAALTRIESERIIEKSTPTLGDPTHGVIIGEKFYYIANSGWDIVDDHGNVKPDAQMTVPQVMWVKEDVPGADHAGKP